MEILSIGEKIRRARVFKGYTLKYICGDKISVSKMSCIENNKIAPEDWILEYISDKLDLDIKYLREDIEKQIKKNIEYIKENKCENVEKELEYNLDFAINHEYFKQAFQIMHMIFIYNIEKQHFDNIQVIIPKYYDICLKCKVDEYRFNYYMDIANYLFNFQEYVQAAGYYNTIKKEALEQKKYDFLADATLKECMCYMKNKQYSIANDIAKQLLKLMGYFKDNNKRAQVYNVIGMLSLILNKEKFFEYEKKCYELFNDDNYGKSDAIYNFAYIMFELGNKEDGVNYIKKALQCYPKDEKINFVEFMLICVEKFIDNNIIESAEEIIDEVINCAINLNHIKYIEKAYHYKAIILGKQNNLISKEMYMNLSLDSLMKFGSKIELYNRYMEMGKMYYDMGNIRESIKYFNLAINLKKKI